jgi:zinc transport system substrate-binding protein
MRRILSALLMLVAPASADVPKVAADIPPVHSLVAAVMGDLGQPILLLDQGADAHDYQMRPSDARALSDADAVFWIGPEMTPWLDRALQDGDPARAISLLDAPGTRTQPFAEGHSEGHDGHADEEHADEATDDHAAAEKAEADANHDSVDPHAFLDPANATLWLILIADRLATLDPDSAAAYRFNAAAEAARIAATDADIAARIAPVADKPIIVFHDAFGYFAAHYRLTVTGSVALGDAADPGAARLSGIRASLADTACIFPEAGHDPKQIATLAEGTSARIGQPLDPEGRELDPGPDLYTALLANLGNAIADCLAP